MDTIALLDSVEHETGPAPEWSVLWLHGLGADGNDFAPIVPELVRPGWPSLRFVFPHAPMRAVTINNGMRMRAWYDIRNFRADELAGGDRADSVGVQIGRESRRERVCQYVEISGVAGTLKTQTRETKRKRQY